MPDFSDAKAGDKVWDNWVGEYRTVAVKGDSFIKLSGEEVLRKNGTHLIAQSEFSPPRYYWDKPEFTDPPRPKRKIKIKRWMNIYSDSSRKHIYSPGMYMFENLEMAIDTENIRYSGGDIRYVTTIPIEFEIEEK